MTAREDVVQAHEWAETFLRDRFPLICRACLVRSDQPEADYPCDRAAADRYTTTLTEYASEVADQS